MLWNQRLGMIPFDAIDNLEWDADVDFQQVKLTAKYWYKKRDLNKKRTFMFGATELKLAYEFLSALHFLMFKMRQDQFSDKFGKIQFPIEKEQFNKQQIQINKNDRSVSYYKDNSSLGNNLNVSGMRRSSFDHRISTNESINSNEYVKPYCLDQDVKEEISNILDTSMGLFVNYLINQAIKPV